MLMPKVSVIIPVYNVEKYLRKCLESIFKQTYKNIEIIVVNDGSTDGSCQVLNDLKEEDDRLIIINKKNGGLSSARNAGIEAATGEYLVFVDSDDWIDEKYIENMYVISDTYDCDIVQCGYESVFFDDSNIKEDKSNINRQPLLYTVKEFSYTTYTLLSWQCNLAWNKLYKKSLFQNIRFPVGKIHEDEFTIYKVVWSANRIGVVSDKLYYYRYRSESIMHQTYSKKRLHASEAFSERELFYEAMGETELSCLTKRWHLEWIKGQKKAVYSMMDNHIKEEILRYFEEKEKMLMEQLDKSVFGKEGFQYTDACFPFTKVEKNASIIIYGGGNVGRAYFRQIYQQDYCKVVLWVDRDVKGCRAQGIPVQEIEGIASCNQEWDYIVLAIADRHIVSGVMKMLQEDYGISLNKIVY